MNWLQRLLIGDLLQQQEDKFMSKFDELMQTIETEKQEVAQSLLEVNTTLQQLRDQIANGNVDGATATQLDEAIAAVKGIHDRLVEPTPEPEGEDDTDESES